MEITVLNAYYFSDYRLFLALVANILDIVIAFANYHLQMLMYRFCDKMKINLVVRKIMFYFAAVLLLVRGNVNVGALKCGKLLQSQS